MSERKTINGMARVIWYDMDLYGVLGLALDREVTFCLVALFKGIFRFLKRSLAFGVEIHWIRHPKYLLS